MTLKVCSKKLFVDVPIVENRSRIKLESDNKIVNLILCQMGLPFQIIFSDAIYLCRIDVLIQIKGQESVVFQSVVRLIQRDRQ